MKKERKKKKKYINKIKKASVIAFLAKNLCKRERKKEKKKKD